MKAQRSYFFAWIVASTVGAAGIGCGPRETRIVTPTSPAPSGNDAQSFVRAEEAFLRAMGATDPRLSTRVGLTATELDLEELETRIAKRPAGERQGGLVGGSLDPFAILTRKIEAKLAYDHFVGVAKAAAPTERAESELVRRLFLAEQARALLEGDLSVYGADLLIAATASLHDADTPDLASARDAWFAERLGDVNDVFATKRTSAMHRRELADSLDPVERLLGASPARFPRAFAVLTKLRETTGEARMMIEGPLPDPSPIDLGNALVVLGEDLRPENLPEVLTTAETALAAKAKEALAALSDRDGDRARTASGKRLALRAPCKQLTPGSLVRSLPASAEREAGCLAVRSLAEAKTPQEIAEAWVLLHDRAAVALWSAMFHASHTTLAVARGKASLLSLADDMTKGALLRRAALRPHVALGPGLLASLLVKDGKTDATVAARIGAFGDGDLASMRAFVQAR